jgi:hypothetical protein
MADIENTEAIVVKSISGRPACKISVLAGNIGDNYIKLYQPTHPVYYGNIRSCPYIGFSFEADARSFSVWICSTDKSFPLIRAT